MASGGDPLNTIALVVITNIFSFFIGGLALKPFHYLRALSGIRESLAQEGLIYTQLSPKDKSE